MVIIRLENGRFEKPSVGQDPLETDLTVCLNDQPGIRKLHRIRYSRNGIRAICCLDDIGIPVFVAIQKRVSG